MAKVLLVFLDQMSIQFHPLTKVFKLKNLLHKAILKSVNFYSKHWN